MDSTNDTLIELRAEVKYGLKEIRAALDLLLARLDRLNGTVAEIVRWRFEHETLKHEGKIEPILADFVKTRSILDRITQLEGVASTEKNLRKKDLAMLFGFIGYIAPIVGGMIYFFIL